MYIDEKGEKEQSDKWGRHVIEQALWILIRWHNIICAQ